MRIVRALLWGLLVGIVAFLVLLLIAAGLSAARLPEAAAVIDRFAALVALLIGIIAAWATYDRGSAPL